MVIKHVEYLRYLKTRREARARARQRDWAKALPLYRRLVEMHGADAGDYVQLGHAYKETGDFGGAIDSYRDAVRADPVRADAYRQLGLALISQNRRDQALDPFVTLLVLEPCDQSVRSFVMSQGLQDAELAKATREAAHRLSAGLETRRGGVFGNLAAYLHRKLGGAAARGRRWKSAERHYWRLLRNRPFHSRFLIQYGHALKEQGLFDRAEEAYRRALVLLPEDGDLALQMGHLYKLKQQFSRARREYARAAGHGHPDAHPNIADLERLEKMVKAQRSGASTLVGQTKVRRAVSAEVTTILARYSQLGVANGPGLAN